MSQSLVKNYLHIVFSTKNRQPFLNIEIREELFAYLAGICKNLDCTPIIIGGHVDHIHILCLLNKKLTLIKLIEELKKNSSKWIKTKDPIYNNFYWQDGYGAFSVNPSEVDKVVPYISNQEEHHKKFSFQDEYRAFLKKYQVSYDEKYVWD